MIVDCFPILNEMDLLEIRLHELSPVVDRFVISEGTRTFSNKPKKLVFQENKGRFREFLDKITYVVLDDYSNLDVEDSWAIEGAQKQLALNAAMEVIDINNDLLIFGDCDEIPNAEVIQRHVRVPFKMAALEMQLYYYYLNCHCISSRWRFCKLVRPHNKDIRYSHIRCVNGDYYIANAGWHFSYLGDIKYKLDSSAHVEYGKPPYNTPEHIEERVKGCKDLFDRDSKFHVEDDLSYLPKYVLDNLDKFKPYVLESNKRDLML